MPAPIRSLRRLFDWFARPRSSARRPRKESGRRGLRFEPLESRQLLSVAPLHAVGMNTVHAREDFQNKVVDLSHAFTDADYSTRALTYEVTGNSNPSLFASLRVVGPMQWLVLDGAPDAYGTAQLSLRATDPLGRTADVSFAVDIAPVNDPPVIASLVDGPDAVIEGALLHLLATGVKDDGQIASVTFYRDVDNDSVLTPAIDQQLGNGVETSAGWALDVSTAGFGSGQQRYFARAVDNNGVAGAVVAATGTVGLATVLDDQGLGYQEIGAGWTSAAGTNDAGGEHREHISGDGTNKALWQFQNLPDGLYRVGVTWTASDMLASNATFKMYDGTHVVGLTSVDQRVAPAGFDAEGRTWRELGSFYVTDGNVSVELSDLADGIVAADSIYLIDPPSIGSVSATPYTLLWSSSLTLTASGVTIADENPGVTVANVHFWLDTNGIHRHLGEATDCGNGTWTLAGISPSDFPSTGAQTYQAVATDTLGQSNSQWTSGYLAEPGISGAASANEGESYTLSLDPQDASIYQWSVAWGDGSTETISGNGSSGVNATHIYGSSWSSCTISSLVCDSNYYQSTSTNSINVAINHAPSVSIYGDSSVEQGSSYALSLSASDPDNNLTGNSSWVINWGDGAWNSGTGSPPSSFTHTYGSYSTYYTVTALVTDSGGANATSNSLSVYVSQPSPPAAPMLGGSSSVMAGASYTLTLSPSYSGNLTGWEVNWGDYSSSSGSIDSGTTFPISLSHTYSSGNTYPVSAYFVNSGVSGSSASFWLTVNNPSPPTVSLSGNSTVDVNTNYMLTLTASDPDNDLTNGSWQVDWGDGVIDRGYNCAPPASLTHSYASANSYSISAVVMDSMGNPAYASYGVTVAQPNTPPTVSLSGNSWAETGIDTTVLLTASDSGNDMTGWCVYWGDGAVSWGSIDSMTSFPISIPHNYSSSNTYTIVANVSDSTTTSSASMSISVTDPTPVLPQIAISGNSSVDTGTTYSLGMSIYNPDNDSISQSGVNWGDGTSNGDSTHVYTMGGSYTISAWATDYRGHSGTSNSLSITVNTPALTLSGNSSVDECAAYALVVSTSGWSTSINQWEIDWGDSTATTGYTSSPDGSLTHNYVGNSGTYTITAWATNSGGTYVTANSLSVTVQNLPPVVTFSGNASVNEGETYSLGLSIADLGNSGVGVWELDWGDGSAVQMGLGIVSDTFTHNYAPNRYATGYTMSVWALDGSGCGGNTSRWLTVQNIAPTVTIARVGSEGLSINEGESYWVDISASDVSDDLGAWQVDWGNGTSDSGGITPETQWPIRLWHPYGEGVGAATIVASVFDTYWGIGYGQLPLTVVNIPPTVTVSPLPEVTAKQAFSISAAYTDPGYCAAGNQGALAYSIDWGDGTSAQTGTIPGATGSGPTEGSVPLEHTYKKGGIKTATVTFSDHGGTVTQTHSVNVHFTPIKLNGVSIDSSVTEGDTVSLSGTIADLEGDGCTGTVNWGDGTSDNLPTCAVGTTDDVPFSLTHQYREDQLGNSSGVDTYTVTTTVSSARDAGRSTTVVQSVNVNDVTPTVGICGDFDLAQANDTIMLAASVFDPGIDVGEPMTYSWTVAYNGATYATGAGPGFSFTPTQDGDYHVELAVTDNNYMTGTANIVVWVGRGVIGGDLKIGGLSDGEEVAPGAIRMVIDGQSDTVTINAQWWSPDLGSGRFQLDGGGGVASIVSVSGDLAMEGTQIVATEATGSGTVTVRAVGAGGTSFALDYVATDPYFDKGVDAVSFTGETIALMCNGHDIGGNTGDLPTVKVGDTVTATVVVTPTPHHSITYSWDIASEVAAGFKTDGTSFEAIPYTGGSSRNASTTFVWLDGGSHKVHVTVADSLAGSDAVEGHMDVLLPSVSIGDAQPVVEKEMASFPLTLDFAVLCPVTVEYSTTSGSATEVEDFAEVHGQKVTIPVGATGATILVPTYRDLKDSEDEVFSVTVSSPTRAQIDDDEAEGTIQHPRPTVSINSVAVDESEMASFMVSLSYAVDYDVTVKYSTANGAPGVDEEGTAKAGEDYEAAAGNNSLTISAGQTHDYICVQTKRDLKDSKDEKFKITLRQPEGATLRDSVGIGTIHHDRPMVAIDSVTVTEGDLAEFDVTLSYAVPYAVTVSYFTADETAKADEDYEGTDGTRTLTIPANVRTATISVDTIYCESDYATTDEIFDLDSTVPWSSSTICATGTIEQAEGWSRDKADDWTDSSGFAIAGSSKNTLTQLAKDITGDGADAALLDNPGTIEKGTRVDITVLLVRLEERLRTNVVSAANYGSKAAEFRSLGFDSGTGLKEAGVNAVFAAPGSSLPWYDCLAMVKIVTARGLISTLKAGEFDQIVTNVGDMWDHYMKSRSCSLTAMQKADYGYFENNVNYLDPWHPGGAYSGENVIMVGTDSYWGFPSGTNSDLGWRTILLNAYNTEGVPPISMNQIPGFTGTALFLNVPKIAMKIFDLRTEISTS